jgi:2-O-methyltransferase
VVWVEPIPDVFAELESNIASLKNQRAFRYILTDRDGDDIELKIASNNGAASSILEIGELTDIWPEIHYTSVIKMKSSTLQTFMQTENIDPNAYNALVLDTQGSELLVLKGAGEMLRHFRFIKTEAADFEAYVGCCQVKDLSEYLSGFGFREIKRKSFAEHSNGGRYYDVVYER